MILQTDLHFDQATEFRSLPATRVRTFRRVRPPERGGADLLRFVCAAASRAGERGIVTSNGPGANFLTHKDMGLVSQVFGQEELAKLKGTRAIGHTRYSTTGTSTIKNAQPFVVDCVRGQMAIAHNGNLINADLLRDELEHKGSIFQTTADSEIILHLLARPADNGASVLAALRRIEGAFSLLIMSERELIAVRDPFGWRPLALGKLDGAYIVASETCALDLIHAEFIREIEPGEVLIINENGLRSERPFPGSTARVLHV